MFVTIDDRMLLFSRTRTSLADELSLQFWNMQKFSLGDMLITLKHLDSLKCYYVGPYNYTF